MRNLAPLFCTSALLACIGCGEGGSGFDLTAAGSATGALFDGIADRPEECDDPAAPAGAYACRESGEAFDTCLRCLGSCDSGCVSTSGPTTPTPLPPENKDPGPGDPPPGYWDNPPYLGGYDMDCEWFLWGMAGTAGYDEALERCENRNESVYW